MSATESRFLKCAWVHINVKVFVPTIENGEELCIRVCFSFCFVFHAKPGTINNDRTGLSDILYLSPFSRDLNHIKKFPKSFRSVEKNSFEIFDFSSNFDRVSRLTLAYLCLI